MKTSLKRSAKWILLACVSCATLQAKPLLNLKDLESKPKGIVRDFYIWEFIGDKDTSLTDSIKAFKLAFIESPKLKAALHAKGHHEEIPKNLKCAKLTLAELIKQDSECIVFGLKLAEVPNMDAATLAIIEKKLSQNGMADSASTSGGVPSKDSSTTTPAGTLPAQAPNLLKKIRILRAPNIAQAMFASDAQIFAEIFNALPYKQKLAIFAQHINSKSLQKLANENKHAFNRVLQSIILDNSFASFKKALAHANITRSDSATFFLLGINEIMLGGAKSRALEYFERSRNTAIDPFYKDRAIFWQYLVSGSRAFLHDLQLSTFVDVFSIYANQQLKTTPNYKIVSGFDALVVKKPPLDISDPFAWQIARDGIGAIKDPKLYEEATTKFYTPATIPHLAHFSNRITKYSTNYYIMPYVDLVQWRDDDQKAMALAIAKQESHFIPALVSRSYALGMMQIMPFNVQPFAKKLGLSDVGLEDMFKPEMAYRFGNLFLDELNAEFKHPLFVAYAYNGGPGFWRRTLQKGKLFVKNRKYEPWLSMELIANEEPRFYGMKVIANYIVYQELLGHKVDLESLLKQTLRY